MKKLILIAVMAVTATAYKKGRRYNVVSAPEDLPPYQATYQSQPFHEQHHPFREQSFRTQPYQSYRQRPSRHDLSSYLQQLSFRDQSPFKDYSSLKARPFHDDSGSFLKDLPDFKERPSFFADEPPFKDPPPQDKNRTSFFANGPPFPDQPMDDRYASYRQLFRDEIRFSDLYDKPISSYKSQPFPSSFDRDPEYLKHGNHGLGYASVPAYSPYEDALPLNEEASTTMAPSMAPTPTHKPLQQSTVSSTAPAITQVHTSATSEPKMASPKASHAVTMPTVKSNTLADVATTSAPPPVSTMLAAVPVTLKQSSNLAHLPAAFTAESSLPVMPTEPPIVSFGRHSLPLREYQTGKFPDPPSYYLSNGLKNKLLHQSLLSYLITKNGIKDGEHSSLLAPTHSDAFGNKLNNKLQGATLSYVVPEEIKSTLKDSLQSTELLNYLLQQESKRGLPSYQQPLSLSEAANYVPFASLAEKPKITLPSVPIASLSAISRPLQPVNFLPTTTLPRIPFVTQDSSVSSAFPLGGTLSSGLSTGVTDSQVGNVFNSLPGGLTGSVSTGISGSSLSPTLSASIPTSNFGQNCQHVGQLRQFEAATSQPYSSGLQLQLGGFGGIDYALRSANPVPRSTDLGIAKVGLSLPELPRHQLPTFSKIELGQRLW